MSSSTSAKLGRNEDICHRLSSVEADRSGATLIRRTTLKARGASGCSLLLAVPSDLASRRATICCLVRCSGWPAASATRLRCRPAPSMTPSRSANSSAASSSMLAPLVSRFASLLYAKVSEPLLPLPWRRRAREPSPLVWRWVWRSARKRWSSSPLSPCGIFEPRLSGVCVSPEMTPISFASRLACIDCLVRRHLASSPSSSSAASSAPDPTSRSRRNRPARSLPPPARSARSSSSS